jgi:hypothetical protein
LTGNQPINCALGVDEGNRLINQIQIGFLHGPNFA